MLSVMIAVFICIDFVNDAMSFFDHPYTKALLIINALLLCTSSFFLWKMKHLNSASFAIGPILALFIIIGTCQSFFDSSAILFDTFAGHILTLLFCAISLLYSLILSYRSTK